ncbi:bifunctional diaminohydroxyphosphoribosylaminopyrimidine deaminase/5-amino-6-(5-phosphoribosylamino)uracil reductase RibD [Paenactinomyces guangxiensis]|uniref:diaminohydroxyphosphoribosylaminopyrimidine deaminase n=1 Tax=Paenactinomyces guangxiensis TaxID=1490290 RepID=A0A7W1WUC3_9BACL|nr:bifunctional diaminohydroxyphosphoribosylaminopyrimidine deaminase/5-amino-6-(5-phosphoribosylamino)uracil reductase RibD [Paenactinomyces guangxiensis]MBA4496209.1 bifunctional diaminohydroxyphosphoribosylaminopyrimidine deaminase/5-amino-6-(5-phosphoribosylamino)uracil reductase RibD [Paenactinomyces guangxiensis]MBH8593298.1 bifunctional diaminohydroxyphosphoribosylaminopyrimidine deaminase/5-amino-6-(5-phosphoribosylamino)uracil reductase RibD [Paenactinomyces guangxiensis]
MKTDLEFMMEAVKEGKLARGKTGTNPPVGAIIVQNGEIVGRGHTSELGGPHAEVNALRAAGDQAKGATVYCTLEPCAHWGRTGPCCEALVEAGVKRVVVGIRDPFPKVDGKGMDYLLKHGVEVTVGFCEEEIKKDLKEFLDRVAKGEQG